MTLTLKNWEIIPDDTNNRLTFRSVDTGDEIYLNEDGSVDTTGAIDADTLQGNSPSDLSVGVNTQRIASSFDESGVTIQLNGTASGGELSAPIGDTARLAFDAPNDLQSWDTVEWDARGDVTVDVRVGGGIERIETFNVSSEQTSVRDVRFNNDGSKMYITGFAPDVVNSYTLSTPYNVSTASLNNTFDVSSQASTPLGMDFNDDGSKMYIADNGNDRIYSYTLSTSFNISTASSNQNLDVSSQTGQPAGIRWNPNGTKTFVVGQDNSSIYEYDVSTAFDITTATFSQSFSFSTEDSSVGGIEFSPDGTTLIAGGDNTNSFYEYALSTGYDLSTMSYTGRSEPANDTFPHGLAWDDGGDRLAFAGQGNDAVLQYDTFSPYTFGAGDVLKSDISSGEDLSDLTESNLAYDITFDDPNSATDPALLWLGDRFIGGNGGRDELVETEIQVGKEGFRSGNSLNIPIGMECDSVSVGNDFDINDYTVQVYGTSGEIAVLDENTASASFDRQIVSYLRLDNQSTSEGTLRISLNVFIQTTK